MNLLAKSFGQLAVLAVALFFFSCEDPTSIGIENPTKKFDIGYVDIPLNSSVVLMDTLRTGNAFVGDFGRLLVGKYNDPDFGNVVAGFYTEYWPAGLVELKDTPVFSDSITLELAFDYYNYGTAAASDQTISIYQLTERMKGAWRKNNNSQVSTDASPLATETFTVDPEEFEDFADDDTVVTVKIMLPVALGRQIFDELVKYKALTDTKEKAKADSAFYANFRETFKGFAVKADVADKIIRFNPASSSIRLKYRTSKTTGKSPEYALTLNGAPGFSQITSDRGKLSDVTMPYQEYLIDDPNRYIQSGIGIFTKVSLDNFYDFADTIPAGIINQAEFIISDVAPSSFAVPTGLGVRLMNNGREIFYTTDSAQHLLNESAYSGFLRHDFVSATQSVAIQPDSAFYFINDKGSPVVLEYSSDKKSYSGYVTMLVQQLFRKDDNRTKFREIVLYPMSPKASKSVNRVIFPADKIKLRIHYTTPRNINH